MKITLCYRHVLFCLLTTLVVAAKATPPDTTCQYGCDWKINYELNGTLLDFNPNGNAFDIELTGLTGGLYLIQLETERGWVTEKLMVKPR